MHRLLLVSTLLFAPLAAQAQVAHSNFDNLVFDNGVSMGGPNLLLAVKTTVPTAFVATRLEVFTGEGAGSNTIALWSNDPTSNQPLVPIGSGTWQMGNANTWQGAPLATPVALAAGQDVWLVWGCQNGSQASVQGTGAGAQPQRGSFDGGVSWNGPFTSLQWKFRIWSGPAGHFESFGAGCPGAAGVPRLSWTGLPMAGSSFDVQLERAPVGTVAGLILGDSNTVANGLPLPLSLQSIGAPNCLLLSSLATAVATGTGITGAASLSLSLPPTPSLAGFPFYSQWFCLDPTANSLGFTFSNGGLAVVGA